MEASAPLDTGITYGCAPWTSFVWCLVRLAALHRRQFFLPQSRPNLVLFGDDMPKKISVSVNTLGELKEFISSCEHAGLGDDAIISAKITMGGKVKELSAERSEVDHKFTGYQPRNASMDKPPPPPTSSAPLSP